MREYEQSRENYMGYTLVIRMFCLDDRRGVFHRECRIEKDGILVGISKTKKEAKDLISGGYMK